MTQTATEALSYVMRLYGSHAPRVGLEREDLYAEVQLAIWRASQQNDRYGYLVCAGQKTIQELLRRFGPRTRTGHARLACVPLERAASLASASRSPEAALLASERGVALWREVERLPQRQRECFVLSHVEGLTLDEISERLGISYKVVSHHLTRGKMRLRERLADVYGFGAVRAYRDQGGTG